MKDFDIDDAINEDGRWETISSEYLFTRPWLTVRHDQVRLPDGRINPEFYVLEYPGWVNIIAITDDGKFVMERQYRHGLGKTCYEIAAGVVEKGETPMEAARRELEEETGYGGGVWTELMVISGNPSTTDNLTHCFLADGVRKVAAQHLDSTEDLSVCLLTLDQVRQLLVSDKIRQALMAAPLWKYFATRGLL
ncbi:MAG: NUDIX hydrolase [Bacteroidetes bacterium]|uniref:GDP-mannose pyrophosphatase n=1 Tax=Candidatus Cryptobacteroides merdigallinarum TaxID=2840770 RepID=A0A9D9HEK6_9BACT|nr:NUDIX hydrolase [Candidatus Cryptobacteroides merdigallinarum]